MRYRILTAAACLLMVHPGGRAASAERPTLPPVPLSIESDPSGASVYLDGRFSGLTPLSVPRIADGDHRLRLVKAGYLENGRVVTIGNKRPSHVRVTLTRGAVSDTGGSQVVSGSGGGGSKKKWIWIGAAAAGASAGAYAATRNNAPPAISGVKVNPTVALAGVTSLTLSADAVDPDGDSLTYSWDFGDGSTGTGQTTTHVYNSAGTFRVTVTVKDRKSSVSGAGTANIKSLTGTWAGNLGSSQSVFFTMVFTQSAGSFAGTYSDTVNGAGTVAAGRLTAALETSFSVQIPGFNAVSFTGTLDSNMDRITGNAVQYAGGPNTFYLNRR